MPAKATGKKRLGKEKTGEQRPVKRVKTEVIAPPSLNFSEIPSQSIEDTQDLKKEKVEASVKGAEKGLARIPELKWKPLKHVQPSSNERPLVIPNSLYPRIWASNREELLATLPEMGGSKCHNGLSWQLYETPILLLDDTNSNVFQIRRENMDCYTLDLVTTRSFFGPVPMDTVEDPPLAFDRRHHAVKKEPEKQVIPKAAFPYKRRKSSSYPLPKAQKLGDHSQASSQSTFRIDFAAPLPIHTSTSDHLAGTSPVHYTQTTLPVNVSSTQRPQGRLATAKLTTKAIHSHLITHPASPSNNISASGQAAAYVPPGVRPYMTQQCSLYTGQRPASHSNETLPPTFFPMATQVAYATPSVPASLEFNETQMLCMQPESNCLSVFSCTSKSGDKELLEYPDLRTGERILAAPPVTRFSVPASRDLESTARMMHIDEAFKSYSVSTSNPHNMVGHQMGIADGMGPFDASYSPISFKSASIFEPTLNPDPTSLSLQLRRRPASSTRSLVLNRTIDTNSSQSLLDAVTSNDELRNTKAHTDPLGEYVPSPIPQEIQAIIDAYLFGKPLTLIMSRGLLYDHWSRLYLPEHMGYAMMGYFRILGLKERRLPLDDTDDAEGRLTVSGQVEWHFRLKWAPGGEEFIMPKVDPKDLEHPWWKPPPIPLPEDGVDVPPNAVSNPCVLEEPEDELTTTPRYRQARISHPEYQFRHNHFRELYESVIPTHLLTPFGRLVRDLSFPRGWFCQECGKLNFQAALRWRQCTSLSCMKKPITVEPYSLSLFSMRDPQDRLPIALPYNTYPDFLHQQVTKFEDGTQTVTYELWKDKTLNPFIKHVFTGNYPPLQQHATKLLEDIQLSVELVRPFNNDNQPYFVYSASCPKDTLNPTTGEWPNVPACINAAKKFIVDRVESFARVHGPQLSVNHMKILAWVTSGTRKNPEVLRAKKKAIIILSFGCDVVLSLIPRSMEIPSEAVPVKEQPWWNLVEEEKIEEEDPPVIPLRVPAALDEPATPAKGKTYKKDRPTFVLTMVHGDLIVLYGDDFEYSIKRDGTSFLLFASHRE